MSAPAEILFASAGAPRPSGRALSLAYIVDGRMPTEKANGYQSVQMCQAFLEAGCRLELLVPNRRILEREGITKDTSLTSYYNLRLPLEARRTFTLDLVPALEALGMGPGNPAVLAASLLRSMTTAASLARRLLRGRHDIIFVRSPLLLLSLLPMLPVALRRKIFFEVHGLPTSSRLNKRHLEDLRAIGGVITVTGELRRLLLDAGLKPEAVITEHDGVDLTSFDFEASRNEARRRLGIPQERRIAAYIGKFHTKGEEKGIPEILRSAKRLIPEFPDLHFLFVGGPLDRTAVYAAILAEEGLPADRFHFLDKQPVSDVPWYLKASDILLMPLPWSKHFAYFVSPLKLFEYMSSGRPIVGSCLPSICEILRDGENALLGEPGNPEAVAVNVGRLLRDPTLGERLGATARANVRKHSWARRAERILGFMAERTA